LAQLPFVVTTNATTYEPGRPVSLIGTLRNTGRACQDTTDRTSGCWAGSFTVSDTADQPVWADGAQTVNEPQVSSCPSEPYGGSPVPAGWSTQVIRAWDQTRCVIDPTGQYGQPNPDCPNTQVATGTYSVTNSASDGHTPAAVIEVSAS
jgi:hypothetical protein